MAFNLIFTSFWALWCGPSPKSFSHGAAANKQPRGVIKRGATPFKCGCSKGAAPPHCHHVFLRLVGSRKRPWWIVGGLPHQNKPRLLGLHVSHFKDKFSLLRFEEELSGRLGISTLLTPPAMPLWDSWISLMDQKRGPPVHTCPAKSDLRGVDAGSVTSGVGNMFTARKWLLPGKEFWGQRVKLYQNLINSQVAIQH